MPTRRAPSRYYKKRKKKHRSGGALALKYAYRTLVTLSAIIVCAYVLHAFAIRDPAIAQDPRVQVPDVSTPTDNPDTPDIDESQVTPDQTPPPESRRKTRFYTFLLVASDQGNGNTDTIMAVSYDIPNQKINLVSIPRDTLVNRTSHGWNYNKINAAYAAGASGGGGAAGGIAELKAAVSELLGIPIDRYVKVDMKAFVRLVDAVGGIDFEVPVRMCYDDPTQNLHIHYDKQMYYGLTGKQVLEIARCRSNSDGDPNVNGGVYPVYPDSDIGRTRTQQKLLVAIAKKMLSWDSLGRLKEYADIFAENVQTDMTMQDIIWFVERVYEGFDLSTGISTTTLPGDGTAYYRGASVYQLYPDKVLEIANTMLNPYTTDLTSADLTVFQK